MELQIIQEKIYSLRGQKVMLDFDLAVLYQVETRRLKEAVRRNFRRFPADYMYELTDAEYRSLRSQIATLKMGRGTHAKYAPFAFTEQGIAMLSGVLHSDVAVEMNISIMRAFIAMRQVLSQYNDLAEKVVRIQEQVGSHQEQLHQIYEAIENLLDQKAAEESWRERERIGFKP